MTRDSSVIVTGLGWEIPGLADDQAAALLRAVRQPMQYGEFDPQRVLGKKGLRYKDRATLLALCAASKAMQDRGLLDAPAEERARIGVCVSSNLGNMDTVCQEAEIIAKEHVDKTSPMNLPVASSNVIPAGIAIRFGCKAINLMLCNGATSGVDALNLSAQMIRAGRADKMIVVGVEPSNPVTERLLYECDPEAATAEPLRSGELAACLILEAEDGTNTARAYGRLGAYDALPAGAPWRSPARKPAVWFVPSQRTPRSRALVQAARSNGMAEAAVIDLSLNTGELYGALGVFQALVALLQLKESGKKEALVSNGLSFGDGLSSIELRVS